MGHFDQNKVQAQLRKLQKFHFEIIMAMSGRLVSRLLIRPACMAPQARSMSGGPPPAMPTKDNIHPVYFKLKERQAKMKEVLHLPVHRKGGRADDVLRFFTYGLAVYVLISSFSVIYEMAYPPKNN